MCKSHTGEIGKLVQWVHVNHSKTLLSFGILFHIGIIIEQIQERALMTWRIIGTDDVIKDSVKGFFGLLLLVLCEICCAQVQVWKRDVFIHLFGNLKFSLGHLDGVIIVLDFIVEVIEVGVSIAHHD